MADVAAEIAERNKLTHDDITWIVPHQANLRIIDSIRQHLDLPEEKFPHNVERYGNTSSASIPLLLGEQVRAGKIKNGDLLAMSAFGAGFSSAACILEWNA